MPRKITVDVVVSDKPKTEEEVVEKKDVRKRIDSHQLMQIQM